MRSGQKRHVIYVDKASKPLPNKRRIYAVATLFCVVMAAIAVFIYLRTNNQVETAKPTNDSTKNLGTKEQSSDAQYILRTSGEGEDVNKKEVLPGVE